MTTEQAGHQADLWIEILRDERELQKDRGERERVHASHT